MTVERQSEIRLMVAKAREVPAASPQGARALAVILECLIAIDEQRQRIEILEAERQK